MTVESAGAELKGSRFPRLSVDPLRDLTPETSRGFDLAQFAADVVGEPLLPWQEELAIRALEVREDGTYRFRTVLALCGRQNGKTSLLRTMALWRIYRDGARLVVGTAQHLAIAKEAWRAAFERIEESPALREGFTRRYLDNTDPHLAFRNGARYRVITSGRGAARGLSVDLLIADEIREHRDWEVWASMSKTTMARPRGQIWCISNAGDAESVVLNSLRDIALSGKDDSIGLFEWSAPDGCALDDPAAWCAANPGLGFTVSVQAIRSALATDPAAIFRTEILCQRVESVDHAVEADAWRSCADPSGAVDRESRVVACFDASPVSGHCTLVVAAKESDGRVRVEVAGAWRDTASARRELPDLLERIGPVQLGWFPVGPGSQLAPVLKSVEGSEEITGTRVSAACQHFADLVQARGLLHPSDPLLDAQISGSHRLQQGDGWRFSRYGQASCDAAYACAGAVLLIESLPAPVRKYSGPLVV